MNLVVDLLLKYYNEEKFHIYLLICISLVINLVQANGISHVTAKIMESVELNNSKSAYSLYYILVGLLLVFILLHYIYKKYQNKILTKLRQWMRYQILRLLLLTNNDDISETNFTKISSPINRISSVCFMLFNDVISNILPTMTFLFILLVYFFWKNKTMGLLFLIGNLVLFSFIYANKDTMMEKNSEYEKYTVDNESYLLEILNNIDKIIYRGQVNAEIDTFEDKTQHAIKKAYDFYSSLENYGLVMHLIVLITVIVLCMFTLNMYFKKEVDSIFFIGFLTMILLYREKMINFVQMVPDFIEFTGRTQSVMKHFKDVHSRAGDIEKKRDYKIANDGESSLDFKKIVFDDVSFKYKNGKGDYLFQHTNLELNTDNHAIIGLTGLSGRGKTTFIKLILKMYKCEEGTITIDGVSVEDIDADYIRKEVTYVSQTAKLFDKVVSDNMLYGCRDLNMCQTEVDEIMKYPKIRELYKNVDIFNMKAGALGENLSGGQRQVANIIGGLVNPSKILILDEPTNALDQNLKMEVIQLIKSYKEKKQAIVIITHDRDVFPIFSENIKL